MAALPSSSKSRSTPRKRLSALRLSTDTTSSLPAYSAPPRPNQASNWPTVTTPPLDKPPDYPQSAEEADREEDDFVPLRLPRNPVHRRLRHRRTSSTSSSVSSVNLIPPSPSVDDLLKRSVVALELSTNALLQSMQTQSSISAIANDQILERSLDRQTRMLDLRLRGNTAAHDGWMEDLDDVMKSVDGLFLDPSDAAISRSLPDRTSHMVPYRPELPKSPSDSPHFHLTTSSEVDLRDTLRAPRALTQYVSVESNFGNASEASANPDSIFLPSTLGLRSPAKVQTFTTGSPPQRCIRKTVSSPGPDFPNTSTTPAYNMLSHLASGQSSRSPSSTGTPSTSDSRSRRSVRRYSAGSADSNLSKRPQSQSRGSSSTSTDTPPPPPVRAMTPPMEESTPSSSDSSSEDNKVKAFRAMQSLRKILDDAPPPPDPKGKRRAVPPRRGFQPRTPPVAPSAGESTATASVYRLFTRSSHHHASSSRPKQSSLKRKSPRLLTPVLPDTPSASSGHSTPRQVSFAELPADHPGRPRNKNKGRRKSGKEKEKEDKGWMSWFTAPGTAMGSAAGAYEERMEDKMMRGWGRPPTGGGATEDWMM
ncbi:hypothetical protein BU17DRAFT_37935 [Hysterangium stoloniferum]|nr:hypothetical protein BU17DRAFT_37935 [Hysterangium stoloniferum]